MRLDLIYELNLLSADAEEIAVFSKILDNYENHKDLINEDDILWKYKWIWSCTFDLPSIPMEQVEAVGEDYKPVFCAMVIHCVHIITGCLWNTLK